MMSFDNREVAHTPFPLVYIRDVFDTDLYEEMVSTFPSAEACVSMPFHGRKYSLSPMTAPLAFRRYVAAHSVWQRFEREISRKSFVDALVGMLLDEGFDLGLLGPKGIEASDRAWRVKKVADNTLRAVSRGRVRIYPPPIRTRFEFSQMPADGGCIKPHTDAPNKLITMVFSMSTNSDWDSQWGGGTSIHEPHADSAIYNWQNRRLEFDQTKTLLTYPFDENQCLIFIKTHNSLHSVLPMTGPPGVFRKTLTVNIER